MRVVWTQREKREVRWTALVRGGLDGGIGGNICQSSVTLAPHIQTRGKISKISGSFCPS